MLNIASRYDKGTLDCTKCIYFKFNLKVLSVQCH